MTAKLIVMAIIVLAFLAASVGLVLLHHEVFGGLMLFGCGLAFFGLGYLL